MTTTRPGKMMTRALGPILALFILTATSSLATAQQPPAPPADEVASETTPAIKAKPAAPATHYPIKVAVKRGDAPLANAAVFLRAARPKGPFEPTDPKPDWEATATTDAAGVANFEKVPRELAKKGLRLHAVATYDGMTFKSAPVTPAANLTLEVETFDRGFDLSTLKLNSLRMIIEPWEDYLVFTQMWSISVTGDVALDTSLIADPAYENGIPLELPIKAQGINVMAPDGEHKIVNSTVYWKGVLKPGQPITLQMRFSMAANKDTFVYEQPLANPVDDLQIIIPLETNYKEKLPRLDNLGIRAPGFPPENIKSGYNVPGLRPDKEFLYAHRQNLGANDAILFQLYNLPYKRTNGPWIALAIGAIGALLVLIYAALDRRNRRDDDLAKLLAALIKERDILLSELLALEADYQNGLISEHDLDAEEMRLKGRVAIIIDKIEDLEASLPSTATA